MTTLNEQRPATPTIDESVRHFLTTNSLKTIEKVAILLVLEKYRGHRQHTCDHLGMGLRTLGMKIKEWGLDVKRGFKWSPTDILIGGNKDEH